MNKNLTWPVDDQHQIEMKYGFFGKKQVLLNGEAIPFEKTGKGKNTLTFGLGDGRSAEITIAPWGLFRVDREMKVEGVPILSAAQLANVGCTQCGAKFKAGDKFCEKCGTTLPNAQNRMKMARLKEAGRAIGYLAAMFLVFGFVMFLVAESQTSTELDKIASYPDNAQVNKLINGKQYTFGELRQEIKGEPYDALILNLVLAAIMFGLWRYSRKSPLVAIITALAVYGSVIVLNAIVDPKSIVQGIIVKIIVIGILIRGIRMALELRKAED